MPATKSLRRKTNFFIVLMVGFSSTGDILLSKGMKQVGSVSVASPALLGMAFLHTVTNGLVWLGIGSFLVFFVCYMLVLSWADYSYVLPVSAVGYAVVPFLGYIVLGETVTSTRWAGVAFICLGVMLAGRTPPRTTEPG